MQERIPVLISQSCFNLVANINLVRISFHPSKLDLDIIFYDDIISYDKHILIPHPRAHERQFVMKPMCDINPYYVHPVYKKRVIDISNELGEL